MPITAPAGVATKAMLTAIVASLIPVVQAWAQAGGPPTRELAITFALTGLLSAGRWVEATWGTPGAGIRSVGLATKAMLAAIAVSLAPVVQAWIEQGTPPLAEMATTFALTAALAIGRWVEATWGPTTNTTEED